MLDTLANNKKLRNYYAETTTEEPILLSDDFNCEYNLNCPYTNFKSPVHILRDNEILHEKVKQYESDIILLKNQIENLKEQAIKLQKENEILKGEAKVSRKKIFKSGRKNDDLAVENKKSNAGRKKGKKYNVKGNSRKRNQNFDEIINVYPEKCDCGNKDITIYDSYDEHVIEDVEIKITVKCYNLYYGYCNKCKKTVHAKGEPIPNIMIGENSRAIAGYLRYATGISYLKIKKIFKDLFNFNLSATSLVKFDKKFTENGKVMYKTIQSMVKTSAYIHADETGWRVDGDNYWLWCFTNKELAFYHIDKSRGSDVVKEVLGAFYIGTLITDFFSAYGVIDAVAKQKCLAHLLRFIKEIFENYVLTENEKLFCNAVKEIFINGINAYKKYHDNEITEKTLMLEKEKITKNLTDVILTDKIGNKKIINLQKRIIKHNEELFVFMENPEIEPTNNFAERMLRANVIMRKITFGNRSMAGAKTHAVIMSIIQTYLLYNVHSISLICYINSI